MDFSRFTSSKMYLRNNTELELRFDFDLKGFTGHNRKTFDDCQSLLYFLQNNPGKSIFITTTQHEDFYVDGDKLVINLKSYQEFCKIIGQNGKNRTQAFLAQKETHYSENNPKASITQSAGEEVSVEPSPEERTEAEDNNLVLSKPKVVDLDSVIVINDQNKKQILEQILSNGYSDDFWALASIKDPELTDRLAAGSVQAHRRKIINELEHRLSSNNYFETKGNDSWQKWIYKYSWLFGIYYQTPIENQKINISGSMPDFLFPTQDGFVDILEIKLPSPEVLKKDNNHSGSWVWSKDVNLAIGQAVNYLCEIDRLKLEIETQVQQVYTRAISMLKPRAFILIGQNNTWEPDKKDGLRKLNNFLHGIEVITYSDLLERGGALINATPSTYAK